MGIANGSHFAFAEREHIYIDRNKTYMRGNLHTHSRHSDGRYTVEETLALYKNHGYEFLAFTDHNVFCPDRIFDRDIVLIHGIECHCLYAGNDPTKGDYVHFNCFLPQTNEPFETFSYTDAAELQADIDRLKTRYGLVQFNHPLFPRFTDEEVLSLHGYDLMEIYNHKDCREETGLDSAEALIWTMLNKGKRLLLTAADDFHGPYMGTYNDTCFGGFIMLHADKTEEAILRALAKGDFYPSTGPLIVDYRREGQKLCLETSPVQRIVFFSNLRRRTVFCDENGADITRASYELTGKETYIWAKAVDRRGKVAWTQPVRFDDAT